MTLSDFRLYHSNALDVLARLLAEEVRRPVPGQSILIPETILIPQAAMRRWLQATLAERYGIAANLQFLTPGEFVAKALDANLPGAREDLNAAALHWRVYAALSDVALMQHPAMAQWRAYIEGDSPDGRGNWPESSRNTKPGGVIGCLPGKNARLHMTRRPSSGNRSPQTASTVRGVSIRISRGLQGPGSLCRKGCRAVCSCSPRSISRPMCCA